MAATSNMRLKWPNPPGSFLVTEIPLEALPSPAAVVDMDGTLLGANTAWGTAHPIATPGASALEWCTADLRAAILSGIRQAIGGEMPRFTQDYGAPEPARRITV